MNQEDKQLLFQDLCARLPYGVICNRLGQAKKLLSVSPYKVYCLELDNGEYMPGEYKVEDIKPYLRPMSSMTSQEWCELCDCDTEDEKAAIFIKNGRRFVSHVNKETFLNSRHFDYRCLIEKGLAIAVTEENNPYET